MPTCYCPNGPKHFDPWPNPRYGSGHDWSANADPYPTLRMDGGKLEPWNVRLALEGGQLTEISSAACSLRGTWLPP
jgi:hypothetical protein